MNDSTTSEDKPKNIATYFILTFVISLPFYILSNFVPDMLVLSGILFPFVPMISALVLTFRESGWDGAKRLTKRSLDFRRITGKVWYAPIFLLTPVVYLMATRVLGFIGESPSESLFPPSMAPILFLMFFILAIGEEVGWTGYAFERMEKRWNAFQASLILGIIWAAWHLPIYYVERHGLLWTAGQVLTLIGLRILLGWIYNNTGRSLFAAIMFHAVANVAMTVLPILVTPIAPAISGIMMISIVVIIMIRWDLKTLT